LSHTMMPFYIWLQFCMILLFVRPWHLRHVIGLFLLLLSHRHNVVVSEALPIVTTYSLTLDALPNPRRDLSVPDLVSYRQLLMLFLVEVFFKNLLL
jgi:hypothetical protein